MPDETQAKLEEDFLSGKNRNPNLTARHLDGADLRKQGDGLSRWRDQLITHKKDDSLRAAYLARVDENILNLQMLLGSVNQDMTAVRKNNQAIYGEVDEHTYRAALDWFAHDVSRYANDEDPLVAGLAMEIGARLQGKRGYRELLEPNHDTFQGVRNDHYRKDGYYALLLADVELPAGNIRPENGNPIVKHVVHKNLQSSYKLRAGKSTWGVVHSEGTVEHPAKYNLTHERFVGLPLGHEIGSHLLEGINGERGPIRLASSTGLDRYELGNEGRAVMREQVVYESFDQFEELVRWRDILRRYVAIGYSEGIGENGLQDIATVYEFVNLIDKFYAARAAKNPRNEIEINQKAHKRTWSLLTRVLKGTDGHGGAYYKDLVYLDGHVKNWRAAQTYGPDVIAEGDLGKFDITNPRHVSLLQEHGLLKSRVGDAQIS